MVDRQAGRLLDRIGGGRRLIGAAGPEKSRHDGGGDGGGEDLLEFHGALLSLRAELPVRIVITGENYFSPIATIRALKGEFSSHVK